MTILCMIIFLLLKIMDLSEFKILFVIRYKRLIQHIYKPYCQYHVADYKQKGRENQSGHSNKQSRWFILQMFLSWNSFAEFSLTTNRQYLCNRNRRMWILVGAHEVLAIYNKIIFTKEENLLFKTVSFYKQNYLVV